MHSARHGVAYEPEAACAMGYRRFDLMRKMVVRAEEEATTM
jgi:hypothetical protein